MAQLSSAYDRSHGRSMVISQLGIVSTSHALASQAAVRVLERGGSAVDAAIAANAVLGVVEPMMNGIGGDLFALYREAASGQLTGLNASGWAPAGLSIDWLKQKGESAMPSTGIHTVTVPGCVDGWAKLHRRFGKLPWADLFQPAIHLAEAGFPLTERVAHYWKAAEASLRAHEYTARVFLPKGRAPQVGELFRNPHLARALRSLAANGPEAFYKGDIAAAILETSRRHQGAMEARDLAEFSAEWVQPLSTTYRGWRVYELPPNSQGMAALEMLNLMEQFPLPQMAQGSAEVLHIQIEAQKLAYQDLARYLADPRHQPVPAAGIANKQYARQRAREIDPKSANCSATAGEPPSGDTTYLAVVDRRGNIISLIQSIYQVFGSHVAVEGFGFHLHNRGALFSFNPAHPNALAGRKRPYHTLIPAYMEKDHLHIGFGIMGGANQAQAHAQFVSNVVDFGMNIQQAMDAPRFTRLHTPGCEVSIEARIPPRVREELESLGHRLTVLGDYAGAMGAGEAVVHDSKNKVNYGASSPRGDGLAAAEMPPFWK